MIFGLNDDHDANEPYEATDASRSRKANKSPELRDAGKEFREKRINTPEISVCKNCNDNSSEYEVLHPRTTKASRLSGSNILNYLVNDSKKLVRRISLAMAKKNGSERIMTT